MGLSCSPTDMTYDLRVMRLRLIRLACCGVVWLVKSALFNFVLRQLSFFSFFTCFSFWIYGRCRN
ncbi:hypothetical protein BDV19DRAFT_362796 [Aspergillus venezuelensis]